MPPLTRGPLPAGVYWRRRVFVILLGATLVFVIANWLGGGSDAKDDDVATAQQAAGEVTASRTITVAGHKHGDKHGDKRGHKGKRNHRAVQGPTFDPAAIAEPDGNCDPADVRVTPRIEDAVAGRDVTIGLSLQTVQADACYFRVGPDKITLKITRGGREIWTSRECPDPVPEASVVVRRAVATVVEMTWDAHESDSSCSHRRSWLLPDDFTVTAATLGGEPADSDFELVSPTPETVTVTPHPKQHRKGKRDDGATDEPRR